jgi:tripartite-type tricarboxylate transporter receptor subunit TctC
MTEYIKAGKFRALAVMAATRLETLPDVPTIAETIPGYEATDWFGIGAPKGTPADVIESLNREINVGLVDPSVRQQLAALGRTPLRSSVSDFSNFVADETENLKNQLFSMRWQQPPTGGPSWPEGFTSSRSQIPDVNLSIHPARAIA